MRVSKSKSGVNFDGREILNREGQFIVLTARDVVHVATSYNKLKNGVTHLKVKQEPDPSIKKKAGEGGEGRSDTRS